jgi:hypothetical protein
MTIDERIHNILIDGRQGIWTSMEGGSLRIREDVLRSCLEMEMAAVSNDAAEMRADMLEALQAVAPLMIPGMNWTDETGQLVKSMVQAAIAKATGAQP